MSYKRKDPSKISKFKIEASCSNIIRDTERFVPSCSSPLQRAIFPHLIVHERFGRSFSFLFSNFFQTGKIETLDEFTIFKYPAVHMKFGDKCSWNVSAYWARPLGLFNYSVIACPEILILLGPLWIGIWLRQVKPITPVLTSATWSHLVKTAAFWWQS